MKTKLLFLLALAILSIPVQGQRYQPSEGTVYQTPKPELLKGIDGYFLNQEVLIKQVSVSHENKLAYYIQEGDLLVTISKMDNHIRNIMKTYYSLTMYDNMLKTYTAMYGKPTYKTATLAVWRNSRQSLWIDRIGVKKCTLTLQSYD